MEEIISNSPEETLEIGKKIPLLPLIYIHQNDICSNFQYNTR